MLAEIFQKCKDQWVRSKYQKGHPFRYATLATVDSQARATMRTVVLRDFDPQTLEFIIYTDDRSAKAKDLQRDSKAQLLFYDPKKLWQIQVDLICVKRSSDPKLFKEIPLRSQKDYTTVLAPGTPIPQPDAVAYNEDKPHFLILTFQAERIESLKLNRPVHIRSEFKRQEDSWTAQFLNP